EHGPDRRPDVRAPGHHGPRDHRGAAHAAGGGEEGPGRRRPAGPHGLPTPARGGAGDRRGRELVGGDAAAAAPGAGGPGAPGADLGRRWLWDNSHEMKRGLGAIDVASNPDLLRIAEDVKRSGKPRVL